MSSVAPALPRVRAFVVSPRAVLGAIVFAGTVALDLLTRQVVTPSVYPDEYLYAQLGRGLATTGHLSVLGVNPHFLPVLQPLLSAPLWLVGDVGTAFRLIQLENALVFSLAAVPAYLIARRLGVQTGLALGVAALSIAGPPALFTGMVMAESFGYTLALCVVLVALRVIERPSLRGQLALLLVSGLASFDRLQLAALPLCVATAVVATRSWRAQRLFLGVIGAAAVGGVAYAAVRGFGYYHLKPRPLGATHALTLAGVDVYVVLLAAGAAIAPSALVGVAQAVARPRTRVEAAFGWIALSVGAVLVLQCVLWGDVHRVQERYLGYLLPLLALSFALRRSRPDRRPVPEIGVAAALAVVAALVPLSGYAIDATHTLAPTLYAFIRIERVLGGEALTAGVFAIAATVLAALGCMRRPLPVLAASLVTSSTLLVFGFSWSGMLSMDGRVNYLPADLYWVDHAVDGSATMFVVGNAWNGQALATLIWNPSVKRVVRMHGSNRVDWLDDPYVQVGRDGTIGGLHGDVLVDTSPATAVVMRGARRVGSFGAMTLWRPAGPARLAAVINNRLSDGRVLRSGGIEVWSGSDRLAGWVELRVHAPRSLGKAHLELVRTGVDVPAGATRVVRVRACGRGPWTGGFVASPLIVRGGKHWRSPIVSVPRYVPDRSACP